MRRELRQLLHDENGMETLEWAVLGAVIALSCLFFYAGLGYQVSGIAIDIINLF